MSTWTIVWDYVGGDCGEFPWHFEREADAREAGKLWVTGALGVLRAGGDEPLEGEDGWPVFHLVEHNDDAAEIAYEYGM